MKKYINKIFLLLAISVFLGACEDNEMVTLDPNAVPVATLSASDVVLDPSKVGETALTITWNNELDYGFQAADNFTVLFDLAGGDFSTAQTKSGGKEGSLSLETAELNALLTNLGVAPETATQINVIVSSGLSDAVNIDSAIESFTATTYPDELDLSTPWGVVGSATPNGWGTLPDTPFYSIPGDPSKLVAYITMIQAVDDDGNDTQGYWKIRKDNSWDLNYGDEGVDGNLEQNGPDIPGEPGTYRIFFDVNNLTYTIEEYSWGLVGDATPNGWDPPDTKLSYDPLYDTWKTDVTFTDGNFKIRFNEDWAVNYGSDAADGNLQAGGADIPVTAGDYEVVVDLNKLTYKVNAK